MGTTTLFFNDTPVGTDDLTVTLVLSGTTLFWGSVKVNGIAHNGAPSDPPSGSLQVDIVNGAMLPIETIDGKPATDLSNGGLHFSYSNGDLALTFDLPNGGPKGADRTEWLLQSMGTPPWKLKAVIKRQAPSVPPGG